MSVSAIWAVLGVALLAGAVIVITKLEGATLGPYSARLIAVGLALAGYYGAMSLGRYAPQLFHPVRWSVLRPAVPVLGGIGALYCVARVLQNWQSELHGLLKGAFKLALVVALAALARLCFSR